MILVDSLMPWPWRGRVVEWCHLVSDMSVEELHEFAARIGCKREWFQGQKPWFPHYDLQRGLRIRAVTAGSVEVDRRGMVLRMRATYGHLRVRKAKP